MSLQSKAKTRHFIVEKCPHLALFVAASVWLGIPLAKAQETNTYTLTPGHEAEFEKISRTRLAHAPSYLKPQFFALRQNQIPIGYIYSTDPDPGDEPHRQGNPSDCQITWLDAQTHQARIIKTLILHNHNAAWECVGLKAIGIISQKDNLLKIGFIYYVYLATATLDNPSAEDNEPMIMTLDPRTGAWTFDAEDTDKVFTTEGGHAGRIKKNSYPLNEIIIR